MSTTKSTTATWRHRMEQKAAAARAEVDRIEAELDKARYAKTDENFPGMLVGTARPRNNNFDKPFAQKANDWRMDDLEKKQRDAVRRARSARERRGLIQDIFIYRRKNKLSDIDLDDEDEFFEDFRQLLLNEEYPAHGPRGRYTDADSDGWREATPYWRRRQPRRSVVDQHVLGDDPANEGDDTEHNEELFEDQHRQFY